MKRFDTRKAILEEIGKKAQVIASRHLTWEPDYDDADLDELWQFIRRGTIGTRKKVKVRENVLLTSPPATRTILDNEYIEAIKHIASMVRSSLGLKSPVRINQLEPILEGLCDEKNIADKPPLGFLYPLHLIEVDEGLYLWLVDGVNIQNAEASMNAQKVELLERALDSISTFTGSHQALSLACLLSDIPIYKHTVDVVVDFHSHINLYIREPAVPMWLVADMYKLARIIGLVVMKKGIIMNPKPRIMSERASTLIDFVNRNEKLDWEQLWDKWNKEYSHWMYRSINSMRVVYYRATPTKLKGGKK